MTEYDKFKTSFDTYLVKNASLVEEYENASGSSIGDYYDIFVQYNSIINISPSLKMSAIFNLVLKRCIDAGMDLQDGLQAYKAELSLGGMEKSCFATYFNEISRIYAQNGNNYEIEVCEANRDKIISMNLKNVISIAKTFQGRGVPVEDLISAGNEGLCHAWEKYDPQRAKLKQSIIQELEACDEVIPTEQVESILSKYLTYGKVLESFIKSNKKPSIKKSAALKWVSIHVPGAKFNSVAVQWITAYIGIEIDQTSRLVRVPKAELKRQYEETGVYGREKLVNLDSPISDENGHTIADILPLEDNKKEDIELAESQRAFKNYLQILLRGVKTRDKNITLKKFGIGLPRPMQPKEIAEQENLSIARVSQIFDSVIQQMQINAERYHVDPQKVFEVLGNLQ